ncbi:hypothetical protein [Alicyclobacillus sp. SO9]|uniref:hypothetical protein n=1 Tax=Alicyclobacillus sp. SO9 TaxID=2665646 RepID=UPI0018E7F626|nr:hypothetical protein [Alicyclobacillus sp. SO9]
MFGTLNTELIHNLPGTRKSSKEDLGEYEPEKHACLTLADLREILTIYFTDVYPNEVHSGLPLDVPTPRLRYQEGLRIGGYPEWIAQDERDYYKIEFLNTEERKYHVDGIHLGTRIYLPTEPHPELISPDSRHPYTFTIKWDPDDISRIYLHHPTTKTHIELRCHKPSYETVEGMNDYTYDLIRGQLKEAGLLARGGKPTDEQIIKGREMIERKTQQAIKTRRAKLRAKRMGAELTLQPKLPQSQKNEGSSIQQLLAKSKKWEQSQE